MKLKRVSRNFLRFITTDKYFCKITSCFKNYSVKSQLSNIIYQINFTTNNVVIIIKILKNLELKE